MLPECLEVQFGWAYRHEHPLGYTVSRACLPPEKGDDAFRITLITSGHIESGINDQRWQVSGGSVMLLPPIVKAETRMTRYLQRSESITIGFRLLLFGSIDITRLLTRATVWHPSSDEREVLAGCMHALWKLPPISSTADRMVRDGAVRAVVGLCWNAIGAEDLMAGDNPHVPEWLGLVMQELRHRPGMTVSELEHLTGYSHAKFFRLFQQFFGVSPRIYLQRYRLDMAKHLLSTTEMSMVAISEHLGFINASDFTRFFRRTCLVTPTEYRQTTSGHGIDLQLEHN